MLAGTGEGDLDEIPRVQIPTAFDNDYPIDLRGIPRASGDGTIGIDLIHQDH